MSIYKNRFNKENNGIAFFFAIIDIFIQEIKN